MRALKTRNRAGIRALELFSHILLIPEHAGVPVTHCYEEHRKNSHWTSGGRWHIWCRTVAPGSSTTRAPQHIHQRGSASCPRQSCPTFRAECSGRAGLTASYNRCINVGGGEKVACWTKVINQWNEAQKANNEATESSSSRNVQIQTSRKGPGAPRGHPFSVGRR